MLGSRVGGECIWRGNGESITTNVKASRHTNDPGTHWGPFLSVYHTLEVHVYPYVCGNMNNAQGKACAGGLYLHHLMYCHVVQVGSHCE